MGDGDRLRASSCKKGMGLNSGVLVSRRERLDADAGFTAYSSSEVDSGGNISQVEVTKSDRSIALRYFPSDL